MDHNGVGSFADVLCDERELDSGGCGTGCEIGLAGKFVRDIGVVGHLERVESRCLGKDWIAAEQIQPTAETLAIGGGEQILLSDRAHSCAGILSLDCGRSKAGEKSKNKG